MKTKLISAMLSLLFLISGVGVALADSQTDLGEIVSYRVSQRGDWFYLKFRANNNGQQTEELQIGPLDKTQMAVYADVLAQDKVHAYHVTTEDDPDVVYYDFFVMK